MTQKRSRGDVVRDVRDDFGDDYQIRKGKAYVGARCKTCGKVFQVPYRGPAHQFALERLTNHADRECVFRNCGRREQVGD